MRTRYVSVLFVITAAMLLLGTASAAQQTCQFVSSLNYFKIISVTWGNSTHPISAGPGMNDVPLTVTLENYGGSCSFVDVNGRLDLYGGISDFNGSSYANYYIGDLAPYSVFNMVFYLNIAQNVSAGPSTVASFPYYISWNYSNDTVRSTQQYNLSIPIYGNPVPKFSVPKAPLVAGELNNISILVQNIGSGAIRNLSAMVPTQSGMSIISQPKTIPLIEPNSSAYLNFSAYLSSASGGLTINLDYNYINPLGYNISTSTGVGTYAIPNYNNGLSISVANQSLIDGVIQNTSIVVKDTSPYPIKNLSVTLAPQSPITLIDSDGILNFPEIQPGATASLPIRLYLTPSSDTVASIDADVSYVLNGQPESNTDVITVLTPGNIDLTSLNTVVLPALPTSGEIFTLTSTLNNVGTETASSVSITPRPPKGITIVGENTTFLGNIPSQTPTSFTLSFSTLSSESPGKYVIPIEVSYLNNLNFMVNTTMDFAVNITKSGVSSSAPPGGQVVITNGNSTHQFNASAYEQYRERSGFPTLLIVIVVVVVVAIVAVYLYRRRSSAKKTKAH